MTGLSSAGLTLPALALLAALAGCGARPPAHAAGMVTAGPPVPEAASPTPLPDAASESVPRAAPPGGPSGLPAPASTPDPDDLLAGLRIDDLAARSYGGPGITIGAVTRTGRGFTQYRMAYQSDGLAISGLADVPDGQGPFPVIIVNHGYLRAAEYRSGADSWRIAGWLAERGYITLMPDYRNYADSDRGPNPFHIGYAVDVMNLIAQVDSLPQAAPGQIGLIGHSMGGEISMWPMVISHEVDAVVLYASMSGDVARNLTYARRYWPAQRPAMEALLLIYGAPEDRPADYAALSPVSYLDQVRMPVMIHHGTHDETVPYRWSEELWQQMQAAGINVTFWSYPGSGHTLESREFEALMTRSLELFEASVRANVNRP